MSAPRKPDASWFGGFCKDCGFRVVVTESRNWNMDYTWSCTKCAHMTSTDDQGMPVWVDEEKGSGGVDTGFYQPAAEPLTVPTQPVLTEGDEMKTDPDEPAFPFPPVVLPNENVIYGANGLTKREYFAAMAMNGVIARTSAPQDAERIALDAVSAANALIDRLGR